MVSSLSNAEPKLSVPLQSDQTHQAQRGAGVRLKLFVGQAAIGIGQIDLLDCIGRTGSLVLAATQMNMDETRAENLLALTSAGFSKPLVIPAGSDSNLLELTELGAALIHRYRKQDSYIQNSSADLKDWLTKQQASN